MAKFGPGAQPVRPMPNTNPGLTQPRYDLAMDFLSKAMASAPQTNSPLAALLTPIASAAIGKSAEKRREETRQREAASINDALFGTTAPKGTSGPRSATASAAASPSLGPVDPKSPAGIADDAMRALGKTPMRPFRDAIASIESAGSGDYSAIGPNHPTLGRALGRYQVMEANIGPWSMEALGREVTPEEFLANPQIQDKIFDYKFGQYVQKFGEEGAAQAWFGGPGGVGKVTRSDKLGTTIGEYGQRFMGAIGGESAVGGSADSERAVQLMGIMNNPEATPEQKAIAGKMLERMMTPADPMGAVSGAPEGFMWAQAGNPAAGLVPIPGYQSAPSDPTKGAPDGTMWADPNNPAAGVVPIPGAPADRNNFRQATPEEAARYGATGGQFGPDGRFYPINPPSGMTVETGPDGQLRIVQGPGAASGKPLTESQAKFTVFQTDMAQAAQVLNELEKSYDPTNMQDAMSGILGDKWGSFLQTPQGQIYRSAALQWLDSGLRIRTGAAATEGEVQRQFTMMFPQPGDKPDTVAYKRRARENFQRAVDEALSGVREPIAPAAPPDPFTPSWQGDGADPTAASPPKITDKAQYDALPPGSTYIAPDGITRRKN
ncbi:hypothetical protein [Neotabrizicola sp. sgz301269]|uniref:hypothetical protein n=1 Tax=Neotabrizicola sp. sgz301269 TaxID=3276282 RepID=UPI003770272A